MVVKSTIYLVSVFLFGLAYFLLGEAGLLIDTGFRGVTPVWLPSGLALLVFIRHGLRYWPGVFIGIALLANSNEIKGSVAIIAACGNTLEAFMGCFLYKRLRIAGSFKHIPEVLSFTLIAFAVPLVAGLLGSLAMTLERGATWSEFLIVSSNWWLGDATGILLVVPLVLVWLPGRTGLVDSSNTSAFREMIRSLSFSSVLSLVNLRSFFQYVIPLSILILISWLSFSPALESETGKLAYFYLIMPLTVLIAIIKAQRGATLAALVVSVVLFVFYEPEIGPFASSGGQLALLLVIAFVCVTSITALVVAALFTERRDAEESLLQSHKMLEESEQRFRQISENIREVFWLLDAETKQMIYVSPSYEDVWGKSCEEIYRDKNNWIFSIHPDDRGEVEKQFSRLWDTGSFEMEYRIIKPGGEVRYIHDKGFPVLDESGKVFRYTGMAEDITDRKEIETLMYNKSEELSKLARFVSVGELGNSLAHEINQPLTSIRCYASGILNRYKVGQEIDRELYEVFSKLGGEAERAGSIINRLRNFVNRDEVKCSTEDINQVIKETLELIEYKINKNEVAVRYDFSDSIPLIIVDCVLVQQAVLNLVLNALEAMEKNESNDRKLIITTRYENNVVTVRVSDSGPGVPEENREMLMKPLFTTKEHGVGLGLSITLRIVEKLGGTLRGYPNDTKGYTFEFTLPVQSSVCDGN